MKRSIIFFLPLLFLFTACSDDKKTEKPQVLGASSESNEAVKTFTQALALSDQGDYQKARALFTTATEQDPKMAIAYLFKANTSRSAKEYADDLNKAKANLTGASEWEKLYYDYSATFLNNDWNKRLEVIQKMVSAFPEDPRAQVELGNTYLGGNQDAKAREAFQKAVQLDPKWVGGYSALAGSYLFSEPKDFKKAEENALKVVELAPKSPGAEITLGDVYRAQNNMEKARDSYTKAIALDPTSSESYYKKGHANSYLGNFDEARQNYLDAAKHDDRKFGNLSNTACTYLYAGDYKKALAYLSEESAKIDASGESKDLITQEKLGSLSACASISMHHGETARLKEVVTAMEPLTTEIGNDIGTEEAKLTEKAGIIYWQAMIAALEGNYDAAKSKAEDIKKTVAPVNDPNKLSGYEFVLGYVNMKEKKFAEAVSHFEKTNPSADVYNRYWLALANEAAGNKDKANSLFKEIAVFNFNYIGYALIRNDAKKKAANP